MARQASKPDRNRALRPAHLVSGIVVGVFLVLHLFNHTAMFWGTAEHRSVMDTLRPMYRDPFVESLLMAALGFQIVSGLTMVVRGWKGRRGALAWTQALSGIALALFLINHVASVWWGRLALALDTNYWFAAAGYHAGLARFFIPYYFIGVGALFFYIACALAWRPSGRVRRAASAITGGAGIVLGAAFTTIMATNAAIPSPYLATYQ